MATLSSSIVTIAVAMSAVGGGKIIRQSHQTTITFVGAPPPCCTSKTVGGVEYILRMEEDTSNYNCVSNCIFGKVEEPGPLFCFAAGDLEVVCDDLAPPSGGEGGEQEEFEIVGVVRLVNNGYVINVTLGCSYAGFQDAVGKI